MRRGTVTNLLLALLCLMSGGCATLNGTGSEGAAPPRPSTAIALSVLSESIYLVNPSTGARAEVVGGLLDFRSGHAAWAPDHQRIAYANGDIYVVDFRHDTQAALAYGDDLSMPAWSPAGDQVVYGDGSSMWRAKVAGGAPTRLPTPASLSPLGMDWGKTGLIAFQGLERDCHPPPRCVSTDRSEIWVLDPATGHLNQITRVGHAESPKWSPDASRILFIRRPTGDAYRELWVMNANGSGARQLSSAENVVAADWARDGSRIALVARDTTRTLRLWIADDEGSNATPLGESVVGTEATVDW